MAVIIQYEKREQAYLKQYQGMKTEMILWTNDISMALGLDFPADFDLTLVRTLYGFSYVRMFLDQIFTAVTVIMIGLGIMLIYSLLLSDVEEKTYEYGMLRALGMEHNSLMALLLIQAVFYSIPGISLGLLGAFLMSAPLEILVCGYTLTNPILYLDSSAIWLGVILGFGMPFVANIVPIQRALSRTLRDSLDIYHSSSSATNVKVVSLEKLGL